MSGFAGLVLAVTLFAMTVVAVTAARRMDTHDDNWQARVRSELYRNHAGGDR